MQKRKEIISYIILVIILIFSIIFVINDKINKENNIKIDNNLNEELKVYFIDVGEADSILIKVNNEYALIDAGNNLDGKKLVKHFKSLRFDKFSYVIGTHAHEDHIGGMDNIIREFTINNYLMPKTVVPTTTYETVVKELNKKNIKYTVPKVNSTFNINEATFKVLSIKDDYDNLNNSSIVIKMTYKDVSFLFMADVEKEIEYEILDKDIKADVIKIGHHGSVYASTDKFLKKVNAKYAVISVGANNDYYHPHEKALKRIKNNNMTLYRTDLDGTIIFSSDGKSLKIETVKTDTNMEVNK